MARALRRHERWRLPAVLFLLQACGSSAPSTTAGGGTDARCANDAECSDGLFCNGAELCIPAHGAADARGCVAQPGPCLAAQTCDEDAARCSTPCDITEDADGDGVTAIECGGTDCDDADGDRYPGNPERCDAEGHDEDCDPDTLAGSADGDGDGDSVISAACCNTQPNGALRCGADCDDSLAGVFPGAVETCNGADDDCDGAPDEGVFQTFYRDLDGDGFGATATAVSRACVEDALFASVAGDCDDGAADVFPGAPERCDGVDNDCDADPGDEVDNDRDGHLLPSSTCEGGPLPKDDCRDDDLRIRPSAVDVCNNLDDDCDDTIDERGSTDAACVTDLATQGADGAICAFSGIAALGRACVVTRCEAPRADCDGFSANGCEVDLVTDPSNCGACGAGCASGECIDGACTQSRPMPAQIALGEMGCIRSTEGELTCWATPDVGSIPTRPTAISEDDGTLVDDAADVSVGRTVACFVRDSGTVACVGFDEGRNLVPDGALIGGSPIAIAGIAAATQIDVSGSHACAVAGGRVLCWGRNDDGQLGDGTTTSRTTPEPMLTAAGVELTDAVEVRTGWAFTCVRRSSGAVRCYGANDVGQLADGSASPAVHGVTATYEPDGSSPPEPISSATALWAAVENACAKVGSHIYCWGASDRGEIQPAQPAVRRAMRTFDDARDAAIGENFLCGVFDDGAVQCEGDPALSVTLPAELGGEQPLVATGLAAGSTLACAIADTDGEVYCWGDASNGVSGTGATGPGTGDAHAVLSRAPVANLGCGRDHACGTDASGRVHCWGDNGSAAIHDGLVREIINSAVWIPGLRDVVEVDGAESTTCARRVDGSVVCWGGLGGIPGEPFGALGNGSLSGSDAPAPVVGLSDARQISTGGRGACALRESGDVVCWGINVGGSLGDGVDAHDACDAYDCSGVPVTVAGLPASVAEVRVGGIVFPGFAEEQRACARLVDGRVFCWGTGTFGGLGRGTRDDSGTPVPVAGIGDAVDIDVGPMHACAVHASGDISCWGANLSDALGATSVTESCAGLGCSTTPASVFGASDAIRVSAWLGGTCFAARNGEVRCWGNGARGTLGDGSLDARSFPGAPVQGVLGASEICGAGRSTCALLPGNRVQCWGADEMLGGGVNLNSPLPLRVIGL